MVVPLLQDGRLVNVVQPRCPSSCTGTVELNRRWTLTAALKEAAGQLSSNALLSALPSALFA
jgi:hypothetical protein